MDEGGKTRMRPLKVKRAHTRTGIVVVSQFEIGIAKRYDKYWKGDCYNLMNSLAQFGWLRYEVVLPPGPGRV